MVIGIFTHFFALETTLAERQFFRALAKLIGRRAARLSACGIAAIVSKMGYLEEGCSVGADGSLYNVKMHNYPMLIVGYLHLCRNTLALLIACTRACRTFSATRGGEWFLFDIPHLPRSERHAITATLLRTTLRTAVVSVVLLLQVSTMISYLSVYGCGLYSYHPAMTKNRKDAGLYLHV
jgi:hypothetical protein